MVQHGVLAKNGSMKQTHFSCQRELQSIAECQSIHLSKQTILKFYPCGIRACATPTPVCSKRRGHASIPRMPRIVDKHTPLPLCTRLSEKAEWQEWELRVDALTCEYACLPPPLLSTNTHTHTPLSYSYRTNVKLIFSFSWQVCLVFHRFRADAPQR